jgi:ribonuclease P protein component
MLSQKHRLSKSAEVKKTTARGRSFFNPFFVLKMSQPAPGSKGTAPRLTVIVSTKVSKKAVDRNRIKRVIREEVRKNISNIKSGDYAILVKSSAAKIESTALREAVTKSLTDSKILK